MEKKMKIEEIPFSSKSIALQSVHSASLGIAVTCAGNQKSL